MGEELWGCRWGGKVRRTDFWPRNCAVCYKLSHRMNKIDWLIIIIVCMTQYHTQHASVPFSNTWSEKKKKKWRIQGVRSHIWKRADRASLINSDGVNPRCEPARWRPLKFKNPIQWSVLFGCGATRYVYRLWPQSCRLTFSRSLLLPFGKSESAL